MARAFLPPIRPAYVALSVALSVALALSAGGRAQTLSFGVGVAADAATAPATRPWVSLQVENARVGSDRVTLGVSYDGAAQLHLGMQANETFGPVGNVVGEGTVTVRTDGAAQGALGVRGVLGPVALGVQLTGFTDPPARFDPLAVAGDARPDVASGGWGVSLDASGRPARTWIVQANPQLYVLPGGTAWRADARVRWLRAIGPHELSLRLRGYLPPGAAGDAALGVGFTYHRRRAPDLDGALYLGVGAGGFAPGLTASLAQDLGPVQARLDVHAEPYRRDVPPYRARLDLSFGVGSGTATVAGAAAHGPGGTSGAVVVRYALPVDLPAASAP
jgi:hypothetical protein